MGSVFDAPSVDDLMASPAGKRMLAFKDHVDTACLSCAHIDYCRGGCPYNALAGTSEHVEGVDPHCTAYKRIFDEITTRMEREMAAETTVPTPAARMSRVRRKAKPGVMTLVKKIVEQ